MLKIRYTRFVASTLVAGVLFASTPFTQAAEEVTLQAGRTGRNRTARRSWAKPGLDVAGERRYAARRCAGG